MTATVLESGTSHTPTPAPGVAEPRGPAPALLLPGQGAQYPGMGTGLYRSLPAFAERIDEVFATMGEFGALLRSDWLAAEPALPMDHVTRSQPLLFAVDYALGGLLLSHGLRPAALLGHSIGEVAAATLAGVFDLADATRLVRDRVRWLAGGSPAGGMVTVAGTREDVLPYLADGVDLAAVNAPRQTLIAGATEPLRATSGKLRAAGFTCVPLPSLTPFHSTVLEPVVEVTLRGLASARLRPPAVPLVSGFTGAHFTDDQAVDPLYWARHPVDPVLFWPALESLLAAGEYLLVECGPGNGLTMIARRHPEVRAGRSQVLSLLGSRTPDPEAEPGLFTAAAARLGVHLP